MKRRDRNRDLLAHPSLQAPNIAAIHDALMEWLKETYPDEHPLAILTALTYEIGRIVGQLSEGLSTADLEEMLNGVKAQMRDHVHAYRRGLRS